MSVVAAATAALFAAGLALAPGASADAFRCGSSGSDPRAWCAYVQKAPNGLKVHSRPSTTSTTLWTLANGAKVEVDCWTTGTSVNGYNIWAGSTPPPATATSATTTRPRAASRTTWPTADHTRYAPRARYGVRARGPFRPDGHPAEPRGYSTSTPYPRTRASRPWSYPCPTARKRHRGPRR